MTEDNYLCALCGRETYVSRLQREPAIGPVADALCLHQYHLPRGERQDWPACERLGVARIAALETELDAERKRADALASAACELFNREDLVNGYALVTATRAILEARKAVPCVSPDSDVTKPK